MASSLNGYILYYYQQNYSHSYPKNRRADDLANHSVMSLHPNEFLLSLCFYNDHYPEITRNWIEVERLVEIYSGNETDDCQQLFRQSLKAALTVAEFEELTSKLDVESSEVAASSDRHVTWTCVK